MTAKNISRLITRLGRAMFVAFFALSVGVLASPQAVAAASMPMAPNVPVALTPVEETIQGELKPLFTGLVPHGNQVEVHVDGQFHGLARVADGGTETDSFAARPALDLEPGYHSVVFRAKDPDTGLRSAATKPRGFWVRPQAAPALVEPVVDSRTTAEQPFVVGFTSNDATVSVYVDGKLDGQVKVGTHESNSVHFAYQVSQKLSEGEHTFTATAVSKDGRESEVSKAVTYEVAVADSEESETAGTSTTDSSSETSDESTSSSEDADSDDTANQSVLGEEDVAEETSDDSSDTTEETTDSEDADADSDDESDSDQEEDADATDEEEDDANNTALVTWIIVIVVLVIILALRLRSGRDGGDVDGAMKAVFTEDKDSDNKGSDNKNKGGGQSPPPPPPSSSY